VTNGSTGGRGRRATAPALQGSPRGSVSARAATSWSGAASPGALRSGAVVGESLRDALVGREAPAGRALRAEPASGAMTSTATGHQATVARCRCGLPAGGEGFDTGVDPEPPGVRAVTVLGQAPGIARWDRAPDGLWHPARTRYQIGATPQPWEALGLCLVGRRHRVVPVG
jgi:hypothetical protein